MGSSPPPHMSLSYVDVREFFNFFVDARALSVSVAGCLWIALGLFVSELLFGGRQGWGLGIPLPFLGCRIRRGSPRDCGWVLGSAGLGAWHPPALSWVPYTSRVSSRLCVASGVLGARGLASPGPNLGAKARLFASSLCLWVPSFSEWCLPFSRCSCCSAFLDISPLCSDWAALHLCVPGVGSRFTTISSFAHFC